MNEIKPNDEKFLHVKKELHKELEKYKVSKEKFTPFYENMKLLNIWLKKGASL